ncbi:MAG: DUF1559 domain-containing protein [Gemmataceae bacterium]
MKRRAFSLVELLIVIAIIGVLLALLLPAIQKARESANRTACSNNLRQIGIAVHSFSSLTGQLPLGQSADAFDGSMLAALLPYLDQDVRYQKFDLAQDAHSAAVNAAGRAGDIATFLCPSDPSRGAYIDPASSSATGRTNYLGNLGAHGAVSEGSGSAAKPMQLRGVFARGQTIRLSDIRDGTTNTVMFAEIKRGASPQSDELDVKRLTPPSWLPTLPMTASQYTVPPVACESPPYTFNDRGLQYYRGLIHQSYYTHTLQPNSQRRDCINITGSAGHFAARSYHGGGVNVVLADASVRFVTDSVSKDAWIALGTRHGSDDPDAN